MRYMNFIIPLLLLTKKKSNLYILRDSLSNPKEGKDNSQIFFLKKMYFMELNQRISGGII